jgi:hypothetical protein
MENEEREDKFMNVKERDIHFKQKVEEAIKILE